MFSIAWIIQPSTITFHLPFSTVTCFAAGAVAISITQNNLSLGGLDIAVFKPLPKSSIDDPMHPKGFSLQYSLCNFVAASFRQARIGFYGFWAVAASLLDLYHGGADD